MCAYADAGVLKITRKGAHNASKQHSHFDGPAAVWGKMVRVAGAKPMLYAHCQRVTQSGCDEVCICERACVCLCVYHRERASAELTLHATGKKYYPK